MPETTPRSKFPRTFWVANVMELFERGAYYGMNALLARYLTDKEILGRIQKWIQEDKASFLSKAINNIDLPLVEIINAITHLKEVSSGRSTGMVRGMASCRAARAAGLGRAGASQ